MGQCRVCQYAQHGGHGNAVISPQGGALCPQNAVFLRKRYGICGKIVGHSGSRRANHIQMPLKHEGRSIFMPRRTSLCNDQVVHPVPIYLASCRFRNALHKVCRGFLVTGDPWNAGELPEKA